MTERWLSAALGLGTSEEVFPWQANLLKKFERGTIPSVLDIPTGLGKTAVIAIWLVARAGGAHLPRRLIYVVDRRAVVDQATTEAERLRAWVDGDPQVKQALQMEGSLPISTLRGQYVDNRVWLEDPASPAIIVGTIDMIGSRLLFEGYGVSRRMRPYHAGLLGADTLLVLDEAHLVPPFEELLKTLVSSEELKPDVQLRPLVPPFRLMSLSATSRSLVDGEVHQLSVEDERHPVVQKRLHAEKSLSIVFPRPKNPEDSKSKAPKKTEGSSENPQEQQVSPPTKLEKPKELTPGERLAAEAWNLAEKGLPARRVLVFANKREDAKKAKDALEKLAGPTKGKPSIPIETELFVGGRRVFERQEASRRLRELGFLAGTNVRIEKPTFLFATSAAEVGVDLDADHLVCDLVAWERMVQRLGRVNRRGEGKADVKVLVDDKPKPTESEQKALEKRDALPEKQQSPEKTKPKQKAAKKQKSAEELSQTEERAIKEFESRLREWKRYLAPLCLLPLQQEEPLEQENGGYAENFGLDQLPLFGFTASPPESPTSPCGLQKDADASDPTACYGPFDASPYALRKLKQNAASDPALQKILEDATTPEPLYPLLTRALVEAWSLTSLESHTGRPRIAPWLRGWEEDKPQTAVVWRHHLPVRLRGPQATLAEVEAFFEAAPPHTSELLETETDLVVGWLLKRTDRLSQVSPSDQEAEPRISLQSSDVVAFALAPDGTFRRSFTLEQLCGAAEKGKKKKKDALTSELCGATLVVDARIAGLKDGLLTEGEDQPAPCADDGKTWGEGGLLSFRVRARSSEEQGTRTDEDWRESFRFATEVSEEGEPRRWLLVEKWHHHAATEEARSASSPQLLADHQSQVEEKVRQIAQKLGLDEPYMEALALAARLHDEGKRAKRWQKAFRAPEGGPYAKTAGPINHAILDGYRHEFGSLFYAVENAEWKALPEDQRDLVLHLIASHHGFARPVIGTKGCEEAPPSALQEQAYQIALRFARLQKRWGLWGLAWWEAILRAADQQASRDSNTPPARSKKEER